MLDFCSEKTADSEDWIPATDKGATLATFSPIWGSLTVLSFLKSKPTDEDLSMDLHALIKTRQQDVSTERALFSSAISVNHSGSKLSQG